jgi:hypothetical protein
LEAKTSPRDSPKQDQKHNQKRTRIINEKLIKLVVSYVFSDEQTSQTERQTKLQRIEKHYKTCDF